MTKRKASEAILVSDPKRCRVEGLEGTATSDEDYDDTASNSVSAADADADADAETVLTGQTSITTRSRKFPSDLKTIHCTYADCNKTFNRPARLTAHLRSHTDDRPYKCTYPDCDKDYREEKHLRQHIKGFHIQERAYNCTHDGCDKSFLTATRLRRHQDVHAGQERFRCRDYPPCSQSFRKHNTLQRHIRSEHLGAHAYPCQEPGCGAGFDSQGALRNHTRREHSEPQFWCEECGGDGEVKVGFTSLALLQAHIRKEHLNCIFCDFKCNGQWELERHVEMHHSGNTVEARKTIPCTWEGCEKMFTKKHNLNVHIRTAHEGFRFFCGQVDVKGPPDLDAWSNDSGCGVGFITKANLEDHIRYVHLGLKRPQAARPNDGAPNLLDDIAGTNRNIACEFEGCSARFIRYHDLQVHLESHSHSTSATPQMDQIEAAVLSLAGSEATNSDVAPFDGNRVMPELPLYGIIPGVTDFAGSCEMSNDELWIAAGQDFVTPPSSWGEEERAMCALIDEDFTRFVDPALGNMA